MAKRVISKILRKMGYSIRKIEKPKINTGLWASLPKDEIRRLFHYEQIVATKSINGDIVECGVATGGTLAFLACLQKEIGDNRAIWAFDSFEGFPEGSKQDAIWFNQNGRPGYKQYTLEFVKEYLHKADLSRKEIDKINFVKGWIPETFSDFPEDQMVSLVNVDVDLYEPTRECLYFFWPKLIEGGRILLDEYDFGEDAQKWPGAKLAVDEFCADTGCNVTSHYTGKSFIEKQPAR